MIFPCLLFVVLMTLYPSLIAASAIPQSLNLTLPQQIVLTSNKTNPLGVGEIHCTKKAHPFARAGTPIYAECLEAIGRFSQSPVMGGFHRNGPADPFRLPVLKVAGRCAIIVSLFTGQTTTTAASWYDIWLAASQINTVCVSSGRFTLYTGGWTDLAGGSPRPPSPPDPDHPFPPGPAPAPPQPPARGRIYVQLAHSRHVPDLMLGDNGNATLMNSLSTGNGTTNFDAII